MKKILTILGLLSVVLWATVVPANIDKAKLDDGTGHCDKHVPVLSRAEIIPADSSANEYCMWTQMQECLAYNPTDEYLEFVCRNFAIGNNLDVWQTDKNFTFTITDENVYSQQLGGGARYPTSVASVDGQGPHISAPVLQAGAWGLMMGQYESGGWFSSFWDDPVNLAGNVGTHKCIGKQLPNGNILFIGVTGSYDILYQTYNYDLTQQLGGGVISPGPSYYFGFDINGGTAYVFWYDANLNVYYKTSTDGIDWSSTQTYNLVWPNPFTNNIFYWGQVAVTDAGNPVIVFDMVNGDDNEYPYEGKVYVSVAPGQPCIEVGVTTAGAENFYPTIATGGNYVVVLFGETRGGTGSNTFWDIYYNYSTDGGTTWHTPVSLTSDINDHNNCLWQIAKRVDAVGNGQFFFAFGCAIANPLLDLYDNIQNGSPTPSRWYVGRNPIVGIAENRTETPKKLALNIAPNPVRNQAHIAYALPKAGNLTIDLYSADGRLVRKVEQGHRNAGFYSTNIDTRELANGAYVVVLKAGKEQLSGKLVVAH
ncbi:MAG: T9SS type A sorting domain-containing protein [candidate division WOR-3 bacterium]